MASVQNPFAALLQEGSTADGVSHKLVEEILLFSLNKESGGNQTLCLADVVVDTSEDTLCEDLVAAALFERLMLSDTSECLLAGGGGKGSGEAWETNAITYLHGAFIRCERMEGPKKTASSTIQELILNNASTCMRQPDLFAPQSFATQWLELFEQASEHDASTQEFLVRVACKVVEEDEPLEALGALKAIFYPLLTELQKLIAKDNLITIKKNVFWILGFFVKDKRAAVLGELLIDYTTPNPKAKGGEYMDTLLGHLLCISILPKTQTGKYEFFQQFSLIQSDPALWGLLSHHQQSTFQLFKQLLVLSPETKRKTLQWIANCLDANVSRGHLWSSMNLNLEQTMYSTASDAFMTSLCAVLVRLCSPLCVPSLKVLLVDPTYCAVADKDRQAKGVSLLKAHDETCLLPTVEGEERVTAEKYNFVTEIFYMTHKCFELANRPCIERLGRVMRELQNTQTAYEDVVRSDPNNDLTKNLFRMLMEQMQQVLSIRNTISEPTNDKEMLKFFEASAIWLTEVALLPRESYEQALDKRDFAPQIHRNLELLSDTPPFVAPYMQSVPESIIDNISAYLNFCRRLNSDQFIHIYYSAHDAFFKMILVFMGSSGLVKNPHLRAKLAEALEFLLPTQIMNSNRQTFVTHVFDNHPDRLKVVRSLLNVFVSIEMTGQSVQFEQKFNYRRPMYAIMNFLWTKQEHVQCFRDLAIEAEENMEAIEPPIFLRFINLLINDAIFLLDESLSNLEQIKQLQQAQDNGEWNSLSQNERQQQVTNLHHLGMLARFDNILGRDTINLLKLLTTEIKSIFCHNSMVDRIAAMLNYFLLHLVGPRKERFKVKDKKEFDFEPAQTVLEISHIYINLSTDDSFCLAVSQDGRSYSDQLFGFAENILIRIGGGQLIGDMSEFAAKVKKMGDQYKEEQELLADAPEEYLDPIISSLMTDPVILPSSKVTVDRSTIARHLLSDQTDPFNREPLTMDKVKSNEALKLEIDQWIEGKRSAARSKS
ncbi:ubiquitin conjugation factor E4 A [Drosophila miranda]|uniref:ubiquitin conjugation factor E4 A n=1 Tax=Drosophila miranda TaxID=7229 RepID=UPI0007E64E1F|nr:ubiquitin conjugation factor E4 A [Drosophila miranda]XP_017154450.1 ubiquitin conjugation factor E4 A [Drosophila miranda]